MNPDLMCAAGVQLGLEQRNRGLGAAPYAPAVEHGSRRLTAVALDPDPPFAAADKLGQG